ncbi:MAG TPA: permease-like cell division protein FtsX [Jatrophihabitans sp.]|nr:permease-like cell division protein FtsX [Jatrophihabitans sp.]
MRANFVLSGVATGLRRNMTMTIALILSTAIALAFVGAAILADIEIAKFKHDYEANLNVSLYLCPKPVTVPGEKLLGKCQARYTEAQKTAVEDKLASDPIVQSKSFISEKSAVERYKKTAPPLQARLAQVGDLPASFVVHLKDLKNDYSQFVRQYQNLPGVSGTTNQSSVLKALLKIIDRSRLFSIAVAAAVMIASILLIANTIQVSAAQRKNETSIMRLVGASRWMTELPFMLETIVAAVAGGLIALGLIWGGKQLFLNGIFRSQIENHVIPDLSSNNIVLAGGVGLIGGVVLAAITAFITLRLFVKL